MKFSNKKDNDASLKSSDFDLARGGEEDDGPIIQFDDEMGFSDNQSSRMQVLTSGDKSDGNSFMVRAGDGTMYSNS